MKRCPGPAALAAHLAQLRRPCRSHSYEYDKANRVYTDNSTSFEGGATSISRTTTNTYDLDGRQNTSTVRRGANIESVTRFGRSTLSGSTWSRGYDDAGNVRWYDVEFHNPDNGNTTYTTSYKSKLPARRGLPRAPAGCDLERQRQKPGDRLHHAELQRGRRAHPRSTTRTTSNRSRVFVNNQSGQALTVVNGNFTHHCPTTPWTTPSCVATTVASASNYANAQYYFFANGNMIGTFGQLQQNGTFVANFDVNYTPISGAYPCGYPVSRRGVRPATRCARIAGRVYRRRQSLVRHR